MKYRYKGRATVSANGYTWIVERDEDGKLNSIPVDVPDSDTATLRKLRTHPSFELVE